MSGALATARKVAEAVRAGGKVLVSCRLGHNRSGFVSALALHMLTGKPGEECARIVRRKRKKALRNPAFLAMLARIKGTPTP